MDTHKGAIWKGNIPLILTDSALFITHFKSTLNDLLNIFFIFSIQSHTECSGVELLYFHYIDDKAV